MSTKESHAVAKAVVGAMTSVNKSSHGALTRLAQYDNLYSDFNLLTETRHNSILDSIQKGLLKESQINQSWVRGVTDSELSELYPKSLSIGNFSTDVFSGKDGLPHVGVPELTDIAQSITKMMSSTGLSNITFVTELTQLPLVQDIEVMELEYIHDGIRLDESRIPGVLLTAIDNYIISLSPNYTEMKVSVGVDHICNIQLRSRITMELETFMISGRLDIPAPKPEPVEPPVSPYGELDLMSIQHKLKQIKNRYAIKITGDDVRKLEAKHKWFDSLDAVSKQLIKLMSLTNPAVTHYSSAEDFKDFITPEPLEVFKYIPRYSNDVIQPCNILLDHVNKVMGISILPSDEANSMLFRVADFKGNVVARLYNNGNYELFDLNDDLDMPETGNISDGGTVAVITQVLSSQFKLRYESIMAAVDKRKVSIGNTSADTVEEAVSILMGSSEDQNSDTHVPAHFIVTMSSITSIPARKYFNHIKRSRKEPTRKMIPHDRREHKNYRYNPDGSVRLEWDVPAAEINGGAKARFGVQISRFKE